MHVNNFLKEFAVAAEKIGAPKFDLELPETLPYNAFADVSRRDLPCHTKAATVASAAVFYHRLAERGADALTPVVESRILQSAQHFSCGPTVERVKSAMLARTDDALPDEKYAFVWRDEKNAVHRQLPLRTEEEVIKAASWFFDYRDQIDYPSRIRVAEKIAAALDVYPVSLPASHLQTLERSLGRAECHVPSAIGQLRKRAALLPDVPMKHQLVELAETLGRNAHSFRDAGQMMKLAKVVDEFDTVNGLSRYYGHQIEIFEDAAFAKTASAMAADEARYFTLANGAVFEKKATARLPVPKLREWLGDAVNDFAAGDSLDAEKFAEEACRLGVEDADRLENLLAASGASPVRFQSTWSGVDVEDWSRLASV
jgi:hypothetical protein